MMRIGVKTYLIAGGVVLTGAVVTAVVGLDLAMVGTFTMAVGLVAFGVGVIGLTVQLASSAARRRAAVAEPPSVRP